jgi:hypothetical protein
MNKGERRGIVPTIENEHIERKTTAIVEDELRGRARRSRGSRIEEQPNARIGPKVEE